jgi:hypothetical protein
VILGCFLYVNLAIFYRKVSVCNEKSNKKAKMAKFTIKGKKEPFLYEKTHTLDYIARIGSRTAILHIKRGFFIVKWGILHIKMGVFIVK